jgi:catechol-2,3-dioxygenase
MASQALLLDRRQILTWASASAALLAAHGRVGWGHAGPVEKKEADLRILSLELLTAAPLPAMKDFYHRSLGLPVREERQDRITFGAGESRLTFVTEGGNGGEPFYHFAFNIPENKILAARDWQLARSPLMPIPDRLQAAGFPEGVVDFSHWNAHSVFFLDPGGNVVEYIARHDLKNAAPGPFGTQDILHASEIGLIVDDVPATAATLREVVGVAQYRGGDERFIALGDEHGLLLVIRRGRTLNFNPEDPTKAARVFRTVASVRGVRETRYVLPGFPHELSVQHRD